MATATTHLLTAEEFYDFVHRPENQDRSFELEDGEIVEMPQPGERHGVVCGNVAFHLGLYIRTIKRGRVLLNDAGLILDRDPDTVRGPDISLFTDIKKYDDLALKYIDEMPTLVVEVLSPSDQSGRMTRRLNRFLDKGAVVVWMVNPDAKDVTLWWQGQRPIVLVGDEEIANIPALPDFRCKVFELFDAPGS